MNDPVTWLIGKLTILCVHVGGVIGSVVAEGIKGIFRVLNGPKRLPRGQQQVIKSQENETARVAGCKQIVLEFATELGFIAREVMTRQELDHKIYTQRIAPQALADELHERIGKIPGVLLGIRHFSNMDYEMKLPYSLRDKHIYMVGRSGSGKTNLIRSMALQDTLNGCGVGIVAAEAELLTEEIIPYIPENRIDDVVYVNPVDPHPVSFNPFHLDPGENVEQKFQDTLAIFNRLLGPTGARMDAILRHSLYALIEHPRTTLLDMNRLFDREDPTFRNEVIQTTADEMTREFFQKTYPAFPKDSHLPITNRLIPLLRPKVIRNLLCNPDHSFHFRGAMDEGKIILFNLSDGVLGEEASQILGQFVVSKIQLAAMSRVDTPRANRHPFYLYLDEFQTFLKMSDESAYSAILSRARKYKLGLCISHQQTSQIPLTLLKDIFGNVTTFIAFNVSHDDAVKLSREYAMELGLEVKHVETGEFLRLRTGQALCKIDKTVFPMDTFLLPSDYDPDRRDRIIARSRRNYGQVGNGEDGITVTVKRPQPPQLPPAHQKPPNTIDPKRVF